MTELAVVIATCDKYSFLWEGWYHYFKKHWGLDLPIYFITETIDCPFPDLREIKVGPYEYKHWTGKINKGVSQIYAENIFLILEDYYFNESIDNLFMALYASFQALDADSLRILRKPSTATAHPIKLSLHGSPVRKLERNSKYLISYVPNIWKRSTLLDITLKAESAWDSEVKGTKRIRDRGYEMYDYMRPNWYTDASRRGKPTEDGLRLIKEMSYE